MGTAAGAGPDTVCWARRRSTNSRSLAPSPVGAAVCPRGGNRLGGVGRGGGRRFPPRNNGFRADLFGGRNDGRRRGRFSSGRSGGRFSVGLGAAGRGQCG
ncbi:hypothetical protein GCM10010430_76180 [Kitasatospora cystarginea]|uniref:Uncharacterized protein n=1 Tax=Kitasatospora cystarginea TaxID=58350 RepID=A0ABN3F0T0_9ACTN